MECRNDKYVSGAGAPALAAASSSAEASALIVSASDKAGMEGIPRERIDAIILRESGNSNYMKQQRKKDAAVDERIKTMKRRLAEHESARGGSGWKQAEERALQPEIDRLMRTRRRLSTCVVVDMDAFYMSCELLSRPELKNVPCVVGRGMVLTSNYVARRYGVRSAMAGWIADTLVKELSDGKEKLFHVPNNFDLYTEKAHEVRSVLAEYDPKLRAYSLDECYMDIAPYLSLRVGRKMKHEEVIAELRSNADKESANTDDDDDDKGRKGGGSDDEDFGDGESDNRTDTALFDYIGDLTPEAALEAAAAIVNEMRQRITERTGLTASAGLASNHMLAKIASDRNKPDGQCIVGPSNDNILSFVRPLSVRKLPGCGRVTEKILNAFNINTVQELFDQRALVQFLFSKQSTATFLLQRSLGWSVSSDSKDDEEDSSGQKGISKERTFQSGGSWSEINSKLEEIAFLLSNVMKRKDIFAHTVTLKCKLNTFDVLSRSKSMARGVYLQSAQDIIPIVSQILADFKKEHKGTTFSVRLLGIRCSNFREEEDTRQRSIDSFLTKKTSKEESASDADVLSSIDGVLIQSPNKGGDGKEAPKNKSDVGTSDEKKSGREKPSSTENPKKSQENKSQPIPSPSIEEGLERQHAICPICSSVVLGNNQALNQHVDTCLNSGTVRKLVNDASSNDNRSKKRRLEDFFQNP